MEYASARRKKPYFPVVGARGNNVEVGLIVIPAGRQGKIWNWGAVIDAQGAASSNLELIAADGTTVIDTIDIDGDDDSVVNGTPATFPYKIAKADTDQIFRVRTDTDPGSGANLFAFIDYTD